MVSSLVPASGLLPWVPGMASFNGLWSRMYKSNKPAPSEVVFGQCFFTAVGSRVGHGVDVAWLLFTPLGEHGCSVQTSSRPPTDQCHLILTFPAMKMQRNWAGQAHSLHSSATRPSSTLYLRHFLKILIYQRIPSYFDNFFWVSALWFSIVLTRTRVQNKYTLPTYFEHWSLICILNLIKTSAYCILLRILNQHCWNSWRCITMYSTPKWDVEET